MRILVTGGAGFIGSHLCGRLLTEHEVVCLDDLSTGSLENIRRLLSNERFRLIRSDVRTVPLEPFDQIYHLACPASPVHYRKDPLQTLRTCFEGTDRLLGLDARFLMASTSEVYGDPLHHPQTEDYWGNVNPIGPRACYDEGKRVAEALCFDYGRLGADIRVARIFNTYGPRMQIDDGRAVSNFIVQALRNEPLTVYGDGSQTRSFCYVDDMVEGLIRMMERNIPGPINLGNPEEISIKTLAETILTMTGSKSSIIHKTLPGDDPKRRRPAIDLAARALGWAPHTTLREGLERTIAYFRAVL